MSESTEYFNPDPKSKPENRQSAGVSAAVIDNEVFIRNAFECSPEKGFEALFRLYHSSLCSHALRFVYTREIAEDIVGEVFYQLWKTNAYKQIRFTFRTYLYAAVRHRAYNYLRDELTGNRTSSTLDELDITVGEESPQTLVEYDEMYQRFEKVISELPSQSQRVFLMSRFENLKNPEIATELGIALKTVEAHLTRALRQIRKALLTIGMLILTGLS